MSWHVPDKIAPPGPFSQFNIATRTLHGLHCRLVLDCLWKVLCCSSSRLCCVLLTVALVHLRHGHFLLLKTQLKPINWELIHPQGFSPFECQREILDFACLFLVSKELAHPHVLDEMHGGCCHESSDAKTQSLLCRQESCHVVPRDTELA